MVSYPTCVPHTLAVFFNVRSDALRTETGMPVALLVGLGLREFSMTPGAIPVTKRVLADADSGELRAMARRTLRMATVDEIERELLASLARLSHARE